MSTRGTYRVYDDYNYIYVCFYIHHDNYPSGAADYFKNMLNFENKNSCSADSFYRANHDATFTKSHSSHGDTEYRYDIVWSKKERKTVLKAYGLNDGGKCFYTGSVEGFITKYGNKD